VVAVFGVTLPEKGTLLSGTLVIQASVGTYVLEVIVLVYLDYVRCLESCADFAERLFSRFT
jgi:hypothetical protein